jgi:hypothetical protein
MCLVKETETAYTAEKPQKTKYVVTTGLVDQLSQKHRASLVLAVNNAEFLEDLALLLLETHQTEALPV